ncbi:MAG TPA: hypothetical protein VGQ36_18810 [Thermoanaerobaculia bacterium]|jgi:hypothetical protein|nr:hypothetical protein [Thermoanaerobaculia bacterium]
MNIAILGWGSLIWCPGGLRIKTRWHTDGPLLPIEFARISQDDRLTLVIQPGSAEQSTYWAFSEFAELKDACKNLKDRERTKSSDIHHVLRDRTTGGDVDPDVASKVNSWVAQHDDVEAVVWTGLTSNWREKRGRDFTAEDAEHFLLGLESKRDYATAIYDRAREYLTHAPRGVDTAVRQAMRARGWSDTSLSSVLFEPSPIPAKSEKS